MLIKRLDYLTEFFLYVLAFGVTFSNPVVEAGAGFIMLCFVIKCIALKDFRIRARPLTFLIILYFAWLLCSLFYSGYHKESSDRILRWLRYFVLFFALVDYFSKDKKRIDRFFWALIAIATFTFISGIFQEITGFSILRHDRTVNKLDAMRRISASFVHPNDFAAYIITVLPLTFAFLVPSLKKWKRMILVVACLLGFYCLFKTSSRGAWLGFLTAIILFFAFYNKKISIAIPIVLAATLLAVPGGRDRFLNLFSQEHNTVWERMQLWKGTWAMIKEHPVVGWGLNTFSRYFPLYKPAEYPDLRYTHNCYLQMWSEIGIIGLIIFVSILVAVFALTLRGIRKKMDTGFKGFVLAGLICGYLAFLIQSALDTNLYSLVLTFHFWALTACIVSINAVLKERTDA